MGARGYRKGRGKTRQFAMLRHDWMDHPNYLSRSMSAKCLFNEFLRQYNGFNNGDLVATWRRLSGRGWKSKQTIARAQNELIKTGWIIKTRQGGKNRPSLYAITVYGIDECKDKLDLGIRASSVPLNSWKNRSEKI